MKMVFRALASKFGRRFNLSTTTATTSTRTRPVIRVPNLTVNDSISLLPAFIGLLSLPVVVVLADEQQEVNGLTKIEDGSVVSNIHTSKWRVFTDNARDLFLQGKLEDAERLFVGALQQAKQGFGERDPHVASACNNLAELYRIKKAFDKAEPLYLEAISILEESYGHEDIRVGAALHNLGQFYLVEKKLDGAYACYERALKIKRRMLGENHADYAETMYHLGKIYINLNKLIDAVITQRKILHTLEVSKGWDSLETVIAAESLALILQSAGSLIEAKQLLRRCLDSRRRLLPADHIQIAANMLHMARVELLLYAQSRDSSTAVIDKAKDLIGNAIRIARQALDKSMKHGSNRKCHEISRTETYSARTALLILMQGLNALSQLEVTNDTLQETGVKHEEILSHPEAEIALLDCVSAFKQFGIQMSLADFGDIKGEYLSCLKHLSALLGNSKNNSLKRPTIEELLNEIKRVEGESAMPNQKP